jgi:nucleoside-diphosphate-sugar epimerase
MDLLQRHKPKEITALVRTDTQKALLAPLGINVVVGDLSDVPLLTRLVEASDLVFNFAVPFNGGNESIQALVDGLEARARLPTTRVKPVLLQTSGSGSVLYGSNGEAGYDIWKVSENSHESVYKLIYLGLRS